MTDAFRDLLDSVWACSWDSLVGKHPDPSPQGRDAVVDLLTYINECRDRGWSLERTKFHRMAQTDDGKVVAFTGTAIDICWGLFEEGTIE
jgi:hypothetical protein